MITNVHLLAFSPCGGTEKISKCLGRDIPLPKQEYNITLPENRAKGIRFGQDDLVFLAFPVYGGRMPRLFSELIAQLRGNETPIVMIAVYGNRAYEGAFLDMDKGVRDNGFIPVGAIAAVAEHSVAPHIASQRPDQNDADKLAEYAIRALEKAQSGGKLTNAPGAYPTWKMSEGSSVFPRTDSGACTECGLCVTVCPNAAIPEDAPQTTILEKCLVCAACVKYCPQNARALGDTKTRVELASHLEHAIDRRESELFV